MPVRPIDLNGMILNTNEVSQVRQSEDVKPEMQQNLMQQEFADEAIEDTTRVKEQENAAEDTMNPDEGNGTGYDAKHRKKQKKKKQEIEGRVVKLTGHGSFSASV